jgi:redox-sensing transcriptional repressor
MKPDRLPLGVASRLARYLQILTQTKKAGRATVSSKTLSEYAHVNPTQIRRDLSAFGRFGKRGVGYDVDYLIACIKDILHTSGQQNLALMGGGKLGSSIAGSDIFADHGFNIIAVFDVDPTKVGRRIGGLAVQHVSELEQTIRTGNIIAGVVAVPPASAQQAVGALVDAGVRIIFNYSDSLVDVPPGVTVHSMSPAGELLYALYFYLT